MSDTKLEGMPIIPPDRRTSDRLQIGWDSCDFCGGKWIEVDIKFDSGSQEPTVGETITGASSGATCTLVSVTLLSGSYAGGDAAGWFKCSSPSAWDEDSLRWGTSEENLNGSSSGANFATLDELGEIKKYGQLYAASDLVRREGRTLCSAHYEWFYTPKDRDDQIIEAREDDRGQEW